MTSLVSQSEVRAQRQITTAIAVGASPETLLSCIARAAARLCHSDMATIALLTDSRDELQIVAVHGTGAPIVGTCLPLDGSLNGLVITAGRSVRSVGVPRDARAMVRTIPLMTGARGVLAVPLRNREGAFGTLGVARRTPWRFSNHDAALLTQLADTASIAIQNAQLREQLRGTARHSTESGAAVTGAALTAQSIPQSAEVGRQLSPIDGCHLSPREREIIKLVASGKTFKEIASILGISGRTVEHYLERLKLRFHQRRLAALVGHMLTHGVALLPPVG